MLLEHIHSYSTERKPQQGGEVLYHKDIGFPKNMDMPQGFRSVVNLKYGSHAKEEALQDKYGVAKLPQRVDVTKGDIFEVGVTGNVVTKLGVRFKYDETRDIIMIINTRDGFVRTVWFNLNTDKHKTLDRTKYATPQGIAVRH